jgi:hypothetical protein
LTLQNRATGFDKNNRLGIKIIRINYFALGIVADSPEAGELASLPRTMSGKPDGELASRNAQIKK